MGKGPFSKAINPREIHYENFQEGIEKFYFTIVEIIENSLRYKINKTEDSFLTSPGSAQWQVFEQRKAAQQEKAAQYLSRCQDLFRLQEHLRVINRDFIVGTMHR